ncbi:hypothetical protein H181DRAFT_05279 [Streptomyces sp. WMMB 714]|uniref:hypothetical protein n=1 Tax=Streptomyces sp. WMMB 714 TaxID=1286822 RepID=UPI0005F81139|nr:hypothetical protein [Streptomyces sp. WMMB 714]SCK56636.1 hypothetical protein H181DRAFT_05279 [Streptomyces sp. WMMB 714]
MNEETHRDHRLLPWPGEDGKPCYLSSDGDGLIDALADEMELMQLRLGAELLDHAGELLSRQRVREQELRFLVRRLGEALRDALRVAESRGARLPVPSHRKERANGTEGAASSPSGGDEQ